MPDHDSNAQARAKGPPIFVAWMPFQRRQLSMVPHFGFEVEFLPIRQTARFLRPFQYVLNGLATFRLLLRRRPSAIWVQLPQVPLLTVALLYKSTVDKNVRIVADCHNRILNPPWCRWPGLRGQLNSCDAVVVHNPSVLPKVQALGVKPDLLRVLEDPPAIIKTDAPAQIDYPKPWLLFLASFSPDEPIDELYEAARRAPDLTFVIAGDAGRASGRHSLSNKPANVVLPGYLKGNALDAAIARCAAVLALTKLNDAQLSSAAEAIGAGQPMVLSDTPVCRAMYYKGGVFVDTNSAESILEGCRQAIARGPALSAESRELHQERMQHWQVQANAVRASLTFRDTATP